MPGDYRITLQQIRDMAIRLRSDHWRILLVHQDTTPPQGAKRVIRSTYRGRHLHREETTRFFRGKNMEGYHVYGRPDTTQYILLDDVCMDGLDAIRADNINISVAVETSPHNYQAWIKVDRNPISRAEALECSRILAERYNGDKGAVSSMQCGRFPGTTNRKPMYQKDDGNYEFARLYAPAMRAVRSGMDASILEEARKRLANAQNPSLSSTRRGCVLNPTLCFEKAIELYEGAMLWLFDLKGRDFFVKQDGEIDRSLLDFHIALHFANGEMLEADLIEVLSAGSKKAQGRDDYIERIVGKVKKNR